MIERGPKAIPGHLARLIAHHAAAEAAATDARARHARPDRPSDPTAGLPVAPGPNLGPSGDPGR